MTCSRMILTDNILNVLDLFLNIPASYLWYTEFSLSRFLHYQKLCNRSCSVKCKRLQQWGNFRVDRAFYATFGVLNYGLSYTGRFVSKTIRTQVGRFVPSGLDVSYPKPGRFISKDWMFRTQGLDVSYPMLFLIFYIWFDIFASKIIRFIYPFECWSIIIHFCSFPILDLVFLFTCIYSPMCDFSHISHCKSYELVLISTRLHCWWTLAWSNCRHLIINLPVGYTGKKLSLIYFSLFKPVCILVLRENKF